MKKISIVTPTYNEVENIEKLCLKIKKICNDNNIFYEHIIIDNASVDGTIEKIKELTAKDNNIKAIINENNFGHIRSPFYGCLQASGNAVIVMWSDFQSPPELILEYYKKWNNGSKVVLGRRIITSDKFFLKICKNFYYSFLSKISNVYLAKNVTGEGLYDESVIKILKSLKDPYPYIRGLIFELGYKVDFLDFIQPNRKYGNTKNNLYTLIDIGLLGIVKHSNLLLRLMIIIGFFFSFLSILLAVFFFIYKILFWNSFQLGLAPILIGFFTLASIQIMIIGLVGEYVSVILNYSKNLPLVIEKERINFD